MIFPKCFGKKECDDEDCEFWFQCQSKFLEKDYPEEIQQILKEEEERQELRDRNPVPIEKIRKMIHGPEPGPGHYPWCKAPFPGWEECPCRKMCLEDPSRGCDYPEREHEYFGEKAIYEREY